jgi:imidazolonepropionase-like amidohydrolase
MSAHLESLDRIPPATNGRRIWLRVGTLLDGVSTAPLPNAHLVYDKNQILFVGSESPPRDLIREGQKEPDIDLAEYTLLPGLIDSHAHLFLEGGELDPSRRAAYLNQTPATLLALARQRLQKLVCRGILAIRDAGDKDGVGLALSKLYAGPDRPLMPYVDSPGAAIHHRGRYGSFMAEPIEDHASPRQCVEARVQAGADRIKLIPTGIINFKRGQVTSEPQMTVDEVRDLVAAANSLGKQTLAHASGEAGIERAIEGGVDTIEHGFFLCPDQLAKMRDHHIGWVPTFAPVQKQLDHAQQMGSDAQIISHLKTILNRHAATLITARQMGVEIIAGSDAGSYGVAHGVDFLYELELMERAGLRPLEVINAASGTASRRLAFKEQFGQIKAGFLSRFLVTRHAPLNGIGRLRRQRFIVFEDKVIDSDTGGDPSGL